MSRKVDNSLNVKKKTKVSYSQYSIGASCLLHWRLKYLDGYKEPSNANLIFGTAIHKAIQDWLSIYYNKKPAFTATFDLHGVFKDALIQEFKLAQEEFGISPCDLPTLMEFYQDGVGILDAVKRYKKDIFPLVGYELIGVEIELEQDINENVYFVGYIDIVIREIKTGKCSNSRFKNVY
jgi:hypothetical protein